MPLPVTSCFDIRDLCNYLQIEVTQKQYSRIILVDGESSAVDYVTPTSLENVPVLKCVNKGSSMVNVM